MLDSDERDFNSPTLKRMERWRLLEIDSLKYD